MPLRREILKTGPKRTVWVETAEGQAPRVVKRFHAPGPLDRFKDRHRAHREVRTMRRLAADGLPVPGGARVRRIDGAWCFETEAVPGGASLDRILDGRAPWPVTPERAARALARLVLDVLAAGWIHPDPHPGNVVLDEAGGAWLIDVARVRRGRPRREVDPDLLCALTASVRETSTRAFRRRFLRALEEGSPGPRRTADQVRELERSARDRRRAHGERQLERWTRESGVVTAARGPRPGWRRREVPSGPWRRLRPRDETHALDLWRDLARWKEHRIPGPDPVLVRLGPRPRILVATQPPVPLLEGLLEDRGLDPRHPLADLEGGGV